MNYESPDPTSRAFAGASDWWLSGWPIFTFFVKAGLKPMASGFSTSLLQILRGIQIGFARSSSSIERRALMIIRFGTVDVHEAVKWYRKAAENSLSSLR